MSTSARKDWRLSGQEVLKRVTDVTSAKAAWVLVQEPFFVGFGVASADRLSLPPGIEVHWDLVSDLRLFGEKGDWHVWSGDGSWGERVLGVDLENQVEQKHYLWGTTVLETRDDWALYSEDRGARFWLPATLGLDPKKDLPVRLAIREHVGRDPRSGLAGIVDAVIVGLLSARGKVIAPPS